MAKRKGHSVRARRKKKGPTNRGSTVRKKADAKLTRTDKNAGKPAARRGAKKKPRSRAKVIHPVSVTCYEVFLFVVGKLATDDEAFREAFAADPAAAVTGEGYAVTQSEAELLLTWTNPPSVADMRTHLATYMLTTLASCGNDGPPVKPWLEQ